MMPDPAPIPPLLWTVRETAQALRLSERSVFRMLARGDLAAVRIGTALRVQPA